MKKILSLIENSKNILIVSLAISFIIIAFSIFYYLVIYIPHQNYIKQQQQIEIEKACKDNLITCKANTALAYFQDWASACKQNAKVVENGYQGCIETGSLPNFCFSLWGKPDPSPNCSLPREQANSIEKANSYKDCYKDYSICIKGKTRPALERFWGPK